jgi:chromosome partitioning protein
MKIVIAQQKGGAGKSTVALILAAVLNEAGKTIKVVDRDPQQSFSTWTQRVGIAHSADGRYTIVDTPPRVFEGSVVGDIESADLVIVPSGTSVSDVEVTAATLPLIESHTDVPVRILWTRVQSNTVASQSLDLIAENVGAESFRASIGLRQCYQQNFLLDGWSALNHAARQESTAFVLEAIS